MSKRDPHKTIDREIRKWMSLYASEYSTATEAAENCAWGLDHDEWLDDELHPVWEIALEWIDEHDTQLNSIAKKIDRNGDTKMTFEQVIHAVRMYYWNCTIPIQAQIQLLERAVNVTCTFALEQKRPAADVWYEAADQPGRVKAQVGMDYDETSPPKTMEEFDMLQQQLDRAVLIASARLGIPRPFNKR